MIAGDRPHAVLAMSPQFVRRLFSAADVARLQQLLDLVPDAMWSPGTEPGPDVLARTEVVITGWGAPSFSDDTLARMPRLRAILHAGGSVRAFIGDAVRKRDIRLTTSADANAEPVAQFALGLVLLAAKNAFGLSNAYGRGLYTIGDNPSLGLFETTVGVIGASRTGRALIRLLRPLGARIMVFDPYLTDADAREMDVQRVDLHELLEHARVVSLHAPDLPSTRAMLGAAEFAMMRNEAVFINTARARLVDQSALLAELRGGRISAMLDVTDPEPLPVDHELFQLPNVFVTPHLAGAQGTELRLLGASVLEEVELLVTGAPAARGMTHTEFERSA